MADLTAFADFAQDWLFAAFAIFVRVGALLALLPAFGEQIVPQRVRLALAVALTAIIAPAIAPEFAGRGATVSDAVAIVAAEALAGLLLGIGLRLFVMTLQSAGAIAAQATSLAQIFGGTAGIDPQPAIAHLLTMAGITLAVMADLHVHVVEALIRSYETFPPGMLPAAAQAAAWGVARVADAFALAFALAAPFVVAALVYNIALGVINRAMPQLMVSFVGAPALTFGSLVLLALAMPVMLDTWRSALGQHLAQPFGP